MPSVSIHIFHAQSLREEGQFLFSGEKRRKVSVRSIQDNRRHVRLSVPSHGLHKGGFSPV